jgi:hypothetical protein
VTETPSVRADGPVRVAWNGLDSQGRPLPAGVYRVILMATGDDGQVVRSARTITLR